MSGTGRMSQCCRVVLQFRSSGPARPGVSDNGAISRRRAWGCCIAAGSCAEPGCCLRDAASGVGEVSMNDGEGFLFRHLVYGSGPMTCATGIPSGNTGTATRCQ
jgi:hypothetical protein